MPVFQVVPREGLLFPEPSDDPGTRIEIVCAPDIQKISLGVDSLLARGWRVFLRCDCVEGARWFAFVQFSRHHGDDGAYNRRASETLLDFHRRRVRELEAVPTEIDNGKVRT